MSASRSATDPWKPLYGDEIGPTRAQRTRSAIVLAIVLVGLGVGLAIGLGIAVLALLALFGASIG